MLSADLSAGGRERSGGSPARPSARRDGRLAADAALAARLGASAAAAIATAALAAGMLLWARRGVGGLAAPLGAGPLTAAVVVGAALALAVDRLLPRMTAPRFAVRLGLAMAIAALVPAGAVAPGGGRAAAGRLASLPALVAAAAVMLAPLGGHGHAAHRRGRRPSERPASAPPDRPARAAAPAPPADVPAAPQAPADAPAAPPIASPVAQPAVEDTPCPEGVFRQRLERYVSTADATETVRGRIVLSVAAGSRSATGHVGFCPPFHQQPQVEVGTSCEAVEAAIVAAEILPWGVRVECRLDEPADEAIDIPVDILARAALVAGDPPDAPSAPRPRDP
ncbi:MAG: hypothetical protein ACKO5R_00005 [Planctomycetaceae bacterium]